jgi:hypothetical protein
MKTGRIYKIISTQGNECYVGSTFDKTRGRFSKHKSQYKEWKKGKMAKVQSFVLFEKYGVDKCKMILIKEYEVCDRQHLHMYEQLWINKLHPINKKQSFGAILLKERMKKINLEYRIKNKDKKKQIDREYYEENKEEINSYKKIYYQTHKEQILARNKAKYEENKEQILARNKKYGRQKIVCEICQCEILKKHYPRHQVSLKHIKNSE